MRIIFITNFSDDLYFLKTIFELGRWLKDEKGVEIILYLPEVKRFSLLPQHVLEIRWLEKELNPVELPEADVIISTDAELAEELNNLSRGRVYYLTDRIEEKDVIPAGVRVIDFHNLRPGLPEKLFQLKSEKRDKIILGGEGLDNNNLPQLFKVLEKAASSIFLNDVLILDKPPENSFQTTLNYQFIKGEETELYPLLSRSFFLIWVSRGKFPVFPLWAMAAGVTVIHLNLGAKGFNYPLEFNEIQQLELILNLLKIYKLGELRNRINEQGFELARKYRLNKAGEEWARYFEEELIPPENSENDFTRPLPDKSPPGSGKEIKPELDIVIINFNTLSYLKKCLQSIRQYTRLPYQLIVVDNGSSDGSIDYLSSQKDILLIENSSNQGYARACNQGILAGAGEYIVLLNSDIEVSEGWLEPLLAVAREEDVAVVGPKLVNQDGEIVGAGVVDINECSLPRGWKIPDGPGVFAQTEDVVSVGGACYLMKRELLPVLGLFDEGYFFYFEELDYSLRAREKGYRVVYCPETEVIHHHEGSLPEGDYLGRKQRSAYFKDSRKRFNNKWGELLSGADKRREPETIVVGGLIPWDFRQQRPQHLIRNLSRLGYKVLYLNPVCGQSPLREVEENVQVWSPPGYGTVLYNLKSGNDINLGRAINKKLRELNFENSILLIDAPYWVSLVKYWEYSILVYDCLDFYTEFEDLNRDKDWLIQAENELLTLADLVLAPSKQLCQLVEERTAQVYYLPNAVEIKHFDYRKQSNKPADMPDFPIIAGYYGAISSWFDVELLAELAAQLPDTGFLLIGEISTDVSRLAGLANVVLLGEKPYQQLPDYLAHFDLALLPFKVNQLTLAADPVKIYEYLAGGKPVVAVQLPELERFRGIIEIADNRSEFINKVKEIVETDKDIVPAEERFKAVKKETWQTRALELKKVLHHGYYGLYPRNGEEEGKLPEDGRLESGDEGKLEPKEEILEEIELDKEEGNVDVNEEEIPGDNPEDFIEELQGDLLEMEGETTNWWKRLKSWFREAVR